jgi:acetolactate decarboxylase
MTKKLFQLFSASVLAILLLGGCRTLSPEVTQVNTIDSLLAGVYDGDMTLGELKRHGDFGIGTFDRLDGEMILYQGVVYQIRADGRAVTPPDQLTTPFAAVTRFQPERNITLSGPNTYADVRRLIDQAVPNQNIFAAVLISGDFAAMHTRSVPAQNKPYRPLAEVTRTQPEFHLQNVTGTVVGFRLPPYVKGLNVPGYHLHFLSADKTCGGHILDFQMEAGQISLGTAHQFRMLLPNPHGGFAAADLSRDRAGELQKVESAIHAK